MCQPATRGIWIDVISAAHELRSGTLTGTPEQLARICRCTVPDLCLALADLSTTGTADIREREGIISITCRRLARIEKEREYERNRKQKQRQYKRQESLPHDEDEKQCPGDNCTENKDLNGCPEHVPPNVPELSPYMICDFSNISLFDIKENIREVTTQEVIGGCGGKEKPEKPPKTPFDVFWDAYPRKENKYTAIKAFEKLRPDKELLVTILSWLELGRQSEQWQDKSKIPHPSVWLNQKRWIGDPPPMATEPQARAPAKKRSSMAWLNEEIAAAEAREAADTGG